MTMGRKIAGLLTEDENEALVKLAQAWDIFMKLPVLQPMHRQEFAFSIHQAQRLIMCRPVCREMNEEKTG